MLIHEKELTLVWWLLPVNVLPDQLVLRPGIGRREKTWSILFQFQPSYSTRHFSVESWRMRKERSTEENDRSRRTEGGEKDTVRLDWERRRAKGFLSGSGMGLIPFERERKRRKLDKKACCLITCFYWIVWCLLVIREIGNLLAKFRVDWSWTEPRDFVFSKK